MFKLAPVKPHRPRIRSGNSHRDRAHAPAARKNPSNQLVAACDRSIILTNRIATDAALCMNPACRVAFENAGLFDTTNDMRRS